MFRNSINFIVFSALILFTSGSVYSQENPDRDTIIINNVNIKTGSGESAAESIDLKEASDWARFKGLTLVPDSLPVVDNKAFLLTAYQTILPVSGYKKELLYRIYIDFIRFEQTDISFNTRLKILIRDIYGNIRQIGTADIKSMSDKKIFEVSVPFDLSYPGKFDIIINEYSDKTGCWGVWDIIVTSKKINEIEIMPIDSQEKMKEIESKIFK